MKIMEGLDSKRMSKAETLKSVRTASVEAEEDCWQMVASLKAGATFGELALISNKPRAATIRAVGDSHFATLDRRTFNIIKGNHKKALD